MRGVAGRVLRYLRAHWPTLAWACAQALLISACELLKPWPLKIDIDSLLDGRPLHSLSRLRRP